MIKDLYNFYTEEYSGTKIPGKLFKRFSNEAYYYVKQVTFNRIDINNLSRESKFAICGVAEKLYQVDKDGGIKSSESVGKHSVVYKVRGRLDNELYSIVKRYLADTGLLYRGVR